MRTSKKFIAGLSAFVVAVSSAVITVSAVDVETDSTDLTISVVSSTENVSAGDVFTVDVVLSNVPETGIAGFEFAVNYDSSALTLKSVVENPDVVGTASDKELELVPDLKDTMLSGDYSCFDYYDNEAGKVACMWATGLDDSAYWINQNGTLVTLTFVANDSISDDSLDFSVGSILDGGDVVFAASNSDGYYAYDNVVVDEPLTVEVGEGDGSGTTTTQPAVTTPADTETDKEPADTTPADTDTDGDGTSDTDGNGEDGNLGDSALLGDANLDGDVNAFDLVMVKKHVLNISELTGQAFTNADVTGDGDVMADDLLIVKKYVLAIIKSFD
jgi:hypothetical protein